MKQATSSSPILIGSASYLDLIRLIHSRLHWNYPFNYAAECQILRMGFGDKNRQSINIISESIIYKRITTLFSHRLHKSISVRNRYKNEGNIKPSYDIA